MEPELRALAESVLNAATSCGSARIVCAESCTGGHIADALTEIPGASKFFCGGIVAYSAEIKKRLLGVPESTLEHFGIVSRECAEAMARGALNALDADWAVATTGVAGPGPQDGIPAGTVCIAVASRESIFSETLFFPDKTREQIKSLATQNVLARLAEKIIEASL